MADTVDVLYVTADSETADAVVSTFEKRRPQVTVSPATDVEEALSVLDEQWVDHVVLDPSLYEVEDAPATAIRNASPDAPIHTLDSTPAAYADDTDAERARLLVDRIAETVPDECGGVSLDDAHLRTFVRAISETMQSLADAETPTEVTDVGVNAAVETFGFTNAVVALYDDEESTLAPTAASWTGEIDDALLGRHADDLAWQVFVDDERRVLEDLGAELDAEVETDSRTDVETDSRTDVETDSSGGAETDSETEVEMSSALAIPLGKHGVFIAADPEPSAFDENDRALADILCTGIASALDRIDREATLREQREELRAKDEELERVDRLNRVVREILKVLTQASSRDEVAQAVCDRLTDAGPYRFAWFGERDAATDEVRPQASAGIGEGYLEAITVTADADDDVGRGPAGRAIRTGEVQVQNDLLGDTPFEPWREQALKRGYRSVASVPVAHRGAVRGVFNLYDEQPGVFDETERTVLAELGETIGYALNALERKQALASNRSVELDFRVRGTEYPILAFVTETEAEFEFENAVQRGDGRLHLFFTIRGSSPEETLGFAEQVPEIESIRLVSERDGQYLYEAALTGSGLLTSLVDRSAMPRAITAAGEEGRFVIQIPHDADVRPVVELFEAEFDRVELVARRERDEPVMTPQEFESEFKDRLTERQREVLELAYFSGFFEWPRESTAEEIANALGVSQPTVSRHIRGAERTLFGLLFGES